MVNVYIHVMYSLCATEVIKEHCACVFGSSEGDKKTVLHPKQLHSVYQILRNELSGLN